VQPGQKVKAGDLIGEVQVIPDVVNLNEAELRLRSTELQVTRAKRELDRAEKLGTSGAAAGYELDKMRSDYELAVEGTNLFDVSYQEIAGVAMPGAKWAVSLGIR